MHVRVKKGIRANCRSGWIWGWGGFAKGSCEPVQRSVPVDLGRRIVSVRVELLREAGGDAWTFGFRTIRYYRDGLDGWFDCSPIEHDLQDQQGHLYTSKAEAVPTHVGASTRAIRGINPTPYQLGHLAGSNTT